MKKVKLSLAAIGMLCTSLLVGHQSFSENGHSGNNAVDHGDMVKATPSVSIVKHNMKAEGPAMNSVVGLEIYRQDTLPTKLRSRNINDTTPVIRKQWDSSGNNKVNKTQLDTNHSNRMNRNPNDTTGLLRLNNQTNSSVNKSGVYNNSNSNVHLNNGTVTNPGNPSNAGLNNTDPTKPVTSSTPKL